MKYYIRRKEGPPILGPFSIEELNAKLTAGEIGKEWVATSDLGESQEELLRTPARDWADITRLQGITQPDSLGGEAGGPMTASNQADTRVQTGRTSSVVAHAATSAMLSGRPAAEVMSRYRDAYLVARTIVGMGSAIKGTGIVALIVIVLLKLVVATQGQSNLITSLNESLFGIVVGVPVFALGILVSAQGQILKATLDTAVNNSPFLSDDQRAEMMSRT